MSSCYSAKERWVFCLKISLSGEVFSKVSLSGRPSQFQKSRSKQFVMLFFRISCLRNCLSSRYFFFSFTHKERFKNTLNKLHAWSLGEYERVVMLDADVLFLANADELFKCGNFCATFINPCIFHTGVLVITPSAAELQRLMGSMQLPSYDGGDQGFLNSYFSDILASPLFNPARPPPLPLPRTMRLSFGYSLDHFYYYQRFAWEIPCGEIKIMTFPSMPNLKPWYWYSWPLLDLSLEWHACHTRVYGLPVWRAAWTISLFAASTWVLHLAVLPRCRRITAAYAALCWPAALFLPVPFIPAVADPRAAWMLYFALLFSALCCFASCVWRASRQYPAVLVLPWFGWAVVICSTAGLSFPTGFVKWAYLGVTTSFYIALVPAATYWLLVAQLKLAITARHQGTANDFQ
eukprot:TRINITY_DN733_c0_g1_i1.p1 TRINITY_DN733_c0_g1~~TRINITY_DN733_c0_g1_i1.p1  ORF type:complete len:406 (+),score=76.63 TRINITY_DN733_c0_g1_i1:389-1606(+)